MTSNMELGDQVKTLGREKEKLQNENGAKDMVIKKLKEDMSEIEKQNDLKIVSNAEMNQLKSQIRDMKTKLDILEKENTDEVKIQLQKVEIENKDYLDKLQQWQTRYEKIEVKNTELEAYV